MVKESKFGLSKRFGSRYGRTHRVKHAEMETSARKRHMCPYCSRVQVKRIAVGIWHCRKCGKKFTGKAYAPVHMVVIKQEVE